MSSFTDTDSISQQSMMAKCVGLDLDSLATQGLLPPKPGSAVGANISPITLKGKPLEIVVGAIERPTRVVFEASTFDTHLAATRLNICV